MTKSLSVRLSGIPLGILEQTDEGALRFEYLDIAKVPISQGLPLTQKTYGNINCEAYFAGLLPESIEARMAIATKYSVSPNNTFGFLACIAHDCAGAISLVTLDTPILPDEIHALKTVDLLDTELEEHIVDLPYQPFFMGVDGLLISLAGVQEKAAVCVLDNKICLPLEDTPTTHILKPPIKRFRSTVQNEYLCIKAASALGLSVPNVEMRKAGIHEYLLVERFDRRFSNANHIVRIHQEDFCQALGARQKYERFEGPGLKDCFDLLLKSAIPAIDRNKLLEIVVFNFLIGNADAHAKNFGLLYNDSGNFRLVPFYDLLCTQISEGLTRDMSMKIGKEYDPDNLIVEDWQFFCKQNEMSFPVLRKVIDNQSKNLPVIVRQLDQEISKGEFNTIITSQIYEQVEKNCRLVRQRFNFQ